MKCSKKCCHEYRTKYIFLWDNFYRLTLLNISLLFVLNGICQVKTSPKILTPEYFGCKENDKSAAYSNAACMQKAFDFCSQNGIKLQFSPNARFYLGKGLNLKDFVCIDFEGATLVATDTIKVLTITQSESKRWKGCLRNCRIELANIGKCGIYCPQVSKFHITDCEIASIGKYAVGVNIEHGFEVFVDNVHFEGWDIYSTGIKVTTNDCHFSDCVMIDCYTAIDNSGSNFYERMHAWMLPRYIIGSTYFRNRTGLTFLNQCFCDTYANAFAIDDVCEMHIAQLKLYHNKDIWKKPYDKINAMVFNFKNFHTATGSKIYISDSCIGELYLEGKDRQVFSNIKNKIQIFNTNY